MEKVKFAVENQILVAKITDQPDSVLGVISLTASGSTVAVFKQDMVKLAASLFGTEQKTEPALTQPPFISTVKESDFMPITTANSSENVRNYLTDLAEPTISVKNGKVYVSVGYRTYVGFPGDLDRTFQQVADNSGLAWGSTEYVEYIRNLKLMYDKELEKAKVAAPEVVKSEEIVAEKSLETCRYIVRDIMDWLFTPDSSGKNRIRLRPKTAPALGTLCLLNPNEKLSQSHFYYQINNDNQIEKAIRWLTKRIVTTSKVVIDGSALQTVLTPYVKRLIDLARNTANKNGYVVLPNYDSCLEEIVEEMPVSEESTFSLEKIPSHILKAVLSEKSLSRRYHNDNCPDALCLKIGKLLKRTKATMSKEKIVDSITVFVADIFPEVESGVSVATLKQLVDYMVTKALTELPPGKKGSKVQYVTWDTAPTVDEKPVVETKDSDATNVNSEPKVTVAGFTKPKAIAIMQSLEKPTDFCKDNWPWIFDKNGQFIAMEYLNTNGLVGINAIKGHKGSKTGYKRKFVEVKGTFTEVSKTVDLLLTNAVWGTGVTNYPESEALIQMYFDAFVDAFLAEVEDVSVKADEYLDLSKANNPDEVIDALTYPSGRCRIVRLSKGLKGLRWLVFSDKNGFRPGGIVQSVRYDEKPVDVQLNEFVDLIVERTNIKDPISVKHRIKAVLQREANLAINGLL